MVDFLQTLKSALAKRIESETGISLITTTSKQLPVLGIYNISVDIQQSQPSGSINLEFVDEFKSQDDFNSATNKVQDIITAINRQTDALKTLEPSLSLISLYISKVNESYAFEESGDRNFIIYNLTFNFIGTM